MGFLSEKIKSIIKSKNFDTYFKQFKFSIFVRVGSHISNFLILIIITRSLSVESFGSYLIIKNIATYIALIAGLGLARFMAREIPGEPETKQYGILRYCIQNEMKFYFIIFIIFIFLSSYITTLLNINEYLIPLIIYIGGYSLWLFYSEIGRFLLFKKRIRMHIGLGAIENFGFFFLVLFFFIFLKGKITISTLLFLSLLSISASAIISVLAIPKSFWKSLLKNPDKQSLKKVLFLNISFLSFDILSLTFEQMDKYLLSNLLGNEATGFFGYSMSWILLISKVSLYLYYLYYPYMADFFKNQNYKSLKKSFGLIAIVGAIIMLFGGLILFIGGDHIVVLVSGKEYLNCFPIIKGLIILPLFIFIIYVCQHLLILMKKEKIVVISYLFVFLIKLLTSLYIIPRWEVPGIVWINNFSYILLCLILAVSSFVIFKRDKWNSNPIEALK